MRKPAGEVVETPGSFPKGIPVPKLVWTLRYGSRGKSGQAEFLLISDGSSTPNRIEFRDGNPDLRKADDLLLRTEYPVSFPDASSLKIVRRGTLTCQVSGCAMTLIPLQPIGTAPMRR